MRAVASLSIIRAIKFAALLKIICAAFVMQAGAAHATPGKLNDVGCHNSQKIGYHCHAERLPKGSGAESVKEREARLKRDCKGRPNAGLCLGYAVSK